MFSTFAREIRFALRGLARDRGFAVTALLSIGLGVGANAAIFSLVDQALFRLLPVRDPARLVLLDWRGSFVGHGWGSDNLMSYPFYKDLRDGTEVFDGVFGRAPTSVNLAFENSAEPVGAEIVTGSYFSVLGVRPWLGRLISEADDQQRGAHPVVVVSFDYWRTHLGARADIVGRTVLINTHPMTIIGVAAPGFHGIDWGEVPSLWIPTMMKREATPDFDWLDDRRGRWMHVFGRLKPGVSIERAQAALQPWFKAMLESDTRREDWPTVTADQQRRYLASSLALIPAATGRSNLRERLERPLLVLLGATAIVLVLACVNVANLYLARGFARRRETALRLALGASRGRIVRDMLMQSLILAVGGAALGLLIAPAVIRTLVSFLPTDASGIDLVTDINLRVFTFALAAACVTAVLFSLAPAFRAARSHPLLALKEESYAVSGGVRLRKILVVWQIALALVLLIGAGLFVRTLTSLRAKGPGFVTANTVLLRIDASRSGYDAPRASRLLHTLLDRFRALPEVEKASISVAELLAGGSWNQQVTIDNGRRIVTDGVVHCNAISPGFFDTLGVPIIAGRDFTERDARDAADVVAIEKSEDFPFRSAIINESFARRYFGNANPVGAHVGLGDQPDTRTTVTIVGVVKTFSYRGIRQTDDQAFFPMFETSMGGGGFWIRTRVEAQSAFSAIRGVVRSVDPTLPITRMITVDDQLDRLLANERLLAMLATAFASLATLLAVVGVYGVIAFVVANRTREIGIRVALGATRSSAVWLILQDTIVMLGCGVVIALPSVWLFGNLIGSQLFGVEPTDWPTIAGAAALIALAAFGASALPVRRVTAIDPIRALRSE
jgi:putative ABC transport system permease protein